MFLKTKRVHCENSKLIWIHHLDENVWILISWLQKPAELDLLHLQKGRKNFEKEKCFVHSTLIKLIIVLKLHLEVVLISMEDFVAKKRLLNFERVLHTVHLYWMKFGILLEA